METLLYRVFTVNITYERRVFRLVTLSFTRLNSDENFRARVTFRHCHGTKLPYAAEASCLFPNLEAFTFRLGK